MMLIILEFQWLYQKEKKYIHNTVNDKVVVSDKNKEEQKLK